MIAILHGGGSELMSHLALSAANQGWELEELEQAIAPNAQDRRDLRRAWPSAVAKAADRRAVIAMARALRERIVRAALPGVTGSTHQVVLRAHLDIMEQAGQLQYHASCRQVAEGSGIRRQTVLTAHCRLIAAGVLRLVLSGAGTTKASTWELAPLEDPAWVTFLGPDRTAPPGSTTSGGWKVVRSCLDAWRGGRGLWKSNLLLYERLLNGEWTEAALAVALGRHLRTIRRQLAALAAVRLAVRAGEVWRAGPASLGRVAVALGVAGKAALQRWQHRMERAAYQKLFEARSRLWKLRDALWDTAYAAEAM
jgi:hypothetical protein